MGDERRGLGNRATVGRVRQALGWLPPDISLSEYLSCLPAFNFAERLAVLWIDSPVFGLRPVRACRVETENVPKPEMFTRSPCLSALMTSSSTMLTALSASPLFSPSLLAKPSIKSALVMSSLPRTRHLAGVNIKIGRPPTAGGPAGCRTAKFAAKFPPPASGKIGVGSGRNRGFVFVTVCQFGLLLAIDRENGSQILGFKERVRIRQHERMTQHLVHVLDLDQGDTLQHLLRNVRDVLFVFLWNEDHLDTAAMSREHLLLESADRQHSPAQGDFARHRQVVADRHAA